MRAITTCLLAVFLIVTSMVPSLLKAKDGVTVGDLRVEQPWARASIGTSRPAAAYLHIVNNGTASDRLVGLESPVAGHIEVHRSMSKGNVMRMEATGPLVIPPGGTVTLKPGAMHVMLMKLKSPLKRGSTFPLVLQFENAGRVELMIPILGPGASGPGRR